MLGLPDWMMHNRLVNVIFKNSDSGIKSVPNEVREPKTIFDINCVTSEVVVNGETINHIPVLDLDCTHWYTESSTPGHGHLVIAEPLSTEQYGELLDVLCRCGIIQEGVYKQWLREGYTAIRLPGVKKGSDRLPDVAEYY